MLGWYLTHAAPSPGTDPTLLHGGAPLWIEQQVQRAPDLPQAPGWSESSVVYVLQTPGVA